MTAPVQKFTVEQIRRLRADAPHFAPDNDVPVQMLCDMALALVAERARLQRLLITEMVSGWHRGDSEDELHECLGLTREEYAAWAERCEIPADWPREKA